MLGDNLPVGWSSGIPLEVKDETKNTLDWFWKSPNGWMMLVGWLITAIATLFGAPFWFDLLQTVIRLKGTGPSPQEKRNESAAAS